MRIATNRTPLASGRVPATSGRPAVALVVAFVLGCLGSGRTEAQLSRPAPVQPATYTSPSGEFELRVTPSNREGSGSARYELTRSGSVQWAGTHVFTLRQVLVTDGGTWAGYAYTDGELRVGEIVIAVIGHDGIVQGSTRITRHGPTMPDGGSGPAVFGMLREDASDRFIVRIANGARVGELWRAFRLSDGRDMGFREAGAWLDDVTAAWTVFVERIPATPWVLVHWYAIDGITPGAVFEVVSFDGERLWKMELPGDYERSPLRRPPWNALASVGPDSRFEVSSVALGVRIEHVVEQDAVGSWRVRELSRAPFHPTVQAWEDWVLENPLAYPELDELESIDLSDGIEERPSVFGSPYVDAAGRVYLRDSDRGTIHIFRADGAVLRTLVPQCNVGGILAWMTARVDGRLFAGTGWSRSRRGVYFDPDGRQRVWSPESDVTEGQWHDFPEGTHRWDVRTDDVRLFDSEDRCVATIDKSANGRWFEKIEATALARDGSLAICESGPLPGASAFDRRIDVHFVSPDGELAGSLRLPAALHNVWSISYDGARVAVACDRGTFLFALSGGPSVHSSGVDISDIFFAPDGTELWGFGFRSPVMRRWRIP